jgi:hypothetical protein
MGTKMRNLRQILVGFVSSILCATAFASGPSVLVLGADNDNTITSGLMSTGLFSSVNYYNSSASTPMIGDFSGYSAVLAFTNYPPANSTGLGDVLKQYVDNGGGLVLNTYAFSNPWSVAGGITTTGYSPLVNTGSNGDVSGQLVQVAPSAIFNGVNLATLTYFHNYNFAQPNLDAGATLLATDGMGVNMIAINASGRIIANNTFPNLDPNNADYYRLTANELLTVAAVPEPETYAMLLIGLGAIGFVAKRRQA